METGAFLTAPKTWATWSWACIGGKPVYLRDVADIVDGAEEPSQYVFFGNGAANGVCRRTARRDAEPSPNGPAPTPSPSRDEVLKKVDTLKGRIIPDDVQVTITRNYGRTAEEKSNELLWHMLHRGGRRVAADPAGAGLARIAHRAPSPFPSTLALTLLMFYLYGFTLNRITLFALIFSIGILVDDAIVVVENIVRHFHLPQNKGRNWSSHRRRSRERSRQPDHPCHVRGDRGRAADGVCRRADGAVHAADSHWVQRGDVFLAGHRVHRHAVGGHPHSALGPEILLR